MYKEIICYFDGACKGNPGKIGMGGCIYQSGTLLSEISFMSDYGTNNEAEYLALIGTLIEATNLGIKNLKVYGDSKLVINQVNGDWKVRHKVLKEYHSIVLKLIKYFDHIKFSHVYRDKNIEADKLANRAITMGLKKRPELNSDTTTTDNDFIFTDFDLNLTILAEECAEVIQCVSKIKRFGTFTKSPKKDRTNIQCLEREIGHVSAMIKCIIKSSPDISSKRINQQLDAKLEKLKSFYN